MGQWEEVDHTADVALRIRGDDLADLLTTALEAMSALSVVVGEVEQGRVRELALEAPDAEALLVDWLNEHLYLAERDGVAYRVMSFDVCTPTRLRARLVGRPILERRRSIKAATYHHLEIRSREGGLETEVVLDV